MTTRQQPLPGTASLADLSIARDTTEYDQGPRCGHSTNRRASEHETWKGGRSRLASFVVASASAITKTLPISSNEPHERPSTVGVKMQSRATASRVKSSTVRQQGAVTTLRRSERDITLNGTRAAFVTTNGANSHYQQTSWQMSDPASDVLCSRHSHSNENDARKRENRSLPLLAAACSNQSALLPAAPAPNPATSIRPPYPCTVTGSRQQAPAAVSSRSAPNMLEHLPAEIKNQVYYYALISEDIIAISRRRGKIAAKSQHFTTGGAGTTTGELALPLLRVNTVSKKEAAPIFYGNDTFLFSNSDHFADWMRVIHGQNTRAVRLIRLQYDSMCHDFFLKPLLARITGIARLGIPHNKDYPAQKLAGDLESFVRGRREHRGKGREVQDVLDALAIYDSSRTARAVLQGIGGEAEAYERDVKVELIKLLR